MINCHSLKIFIEAIIELNCFMVAFYKSLFSFFCQW